MSRPNKKFITVSWKPGREPVDDMFWCEAEVEGAWTTITSIDRLRTRREIVERITQLEQATIGFDFGFSYPKAFLDFLATEGIDSTWQAIAKKVREELKKNTDDGVRLWIDRMGRYREAHLESEASANHFIPASRDGRRNYRPEPLQPYERRSLAERFRRIDLVLKRKYPEAIASVLGIRYNKLTTRYEFGDSERRGRATLLGIAMLEQLIEAKPDISIWPFMKPSAVTVVEIFPRLFANKIDHDAESLRKFFDTEEDNGLFVAREVRELLYTSAPSLEIFLALIGMIKAESREDKSLRPIRDYRDYFYENTEVMAEGWSYGIGFKETEKQAKAIQEPAALATEEVTGIVTEQTPGEAPLAA
ncbi:MAG: hypothetical protein ABI778_00470 [Ignavibacteriota bacterium]